MNFIFYRNKQLFQFVSRPYAMALGLLAYILIGGMPPVNAEIIFSHTSIHTSAMAYPDKKKDLLMVRLYKSYKKALTSHTAHDNPMEQYKIWLSEWGAYAKAHDQYWKYGQFGTLSTIDPKTHTPRGRTMRVLLVKDQGIVLGSAPNSPKTSHFAKGQKVSFLIYWHLGNVVYQFELMGRMEPYMPALSELIAQPTPNFQPYILAPEKCLISLGKYYGTGSRSGGVKPIYNYVAYQKAADGWHKQDLNSYPGIALN